jgi:hypothetical protein
VKREKNGNNRQREKNNGRREEAIGEEQQPHTIRTTRGLNN